MDIIALILSLSFTGCMLILCGAYRYFVAGTNRHTEAKNLRGEITRLLQSIVETYGHNARNGFLHAIRAANPSRHHDSMARRILKIGEEYGETCEAYLVSTTGKPSRKVKTHDDVREELIDVAIVALDCAVTRFPGEENLLDVEIEMKIMEVLAVKLMKWKANVDTTRNHNG
jgi:NTP pyrophosphatase (non-canonical NTP hydrolase)